MNDKGLAPCGMGSERYGKWAELHPLDLNVRMDGEELGRSKGSRQETENAQVSDLPQ